MLVMTSNWSRSGRNCAINSLAPVSAIYPGWLIVVVESRAMKNVEEWVYPCRVYTGKIECDRCDAFAFVGALKRIILL